jgi:methyl-accepting chemotaxis protein
LRGGEPSRAATARTLGNRKLRENTCAADDTNKLTSRAQAAQGTAQVATNITDVSRGASDTGMASSQVLGSAQALSRESGRLRREVEKFVRTVRAA